MVSLNSRFALAFWMVKLKLNHNVLSLFKKLNQNVWIVLWPASILHFHILLNESRTEFQSACHSGT